MRRQTWTWADALEAVADLTREGARPDIRSVAARMGCSYAMAWRRLMDAVDLGLVARPMGSKKGGATIGFWLTERGRRETLWRAS